jgi:hypothetical protein
MSEIKRTGNKLLIVGGIIEIALAFICMFLGVLATAIFLTAADPFRDYQARVQNSVGIVGLVAFAFGFAGAIFAFKRRYLSLAVFGTIVIVIWAVMFAKLALIAPVSSQLTGVMFSMFVFIFSIISMVFIVVSRKEFEKEGVKP